LDIIIAKYAGFCFGVQRAMDLANAEVEKKDNNKKYSYGPLIHNKQVVKYLSNKGLNVIESIDEVVSGKIIIRSHGVAKIIIEEFEANNIEVIDTTCPYVKSVHKRVEESSSKGYDIIIIGDKDHPEVIGINGWCENKAFIVNSVEEANNLPMFDKLCVVSQTTNMIEKFNNITSVLKEKAEDVVIYDTICNATKVRQEAAIELSKYVDAMVVLGGLHSSNTKKLSELSRLNCKNVFHVETIEDLSLQDIRNFNKIGITAGASTPDWIIKEAVQVMDNLNNNEMMEAIENSFTRINRGEVLNGTILYVTDNEVMVNINYRTDGIISRDEMSLGSDEKLKDIYKVGDEIKVFVVKLDDGQGNVVLSANRVADMLNWDVLEEDFKNNTILEGKVLKAVKGGLIVSVKGINGFMPASHISTNYITDLEQFRGKIFKAKIIDFDKEKKRIILSRKEVEKVELQGKKQEVWGALELNKVVSGVVQRITDFGAFVDLGGVDGLIHISDLSWERVKHPSDIFKPGDKVNVKVLDFDKEKNRISLGLKQTVEEPWQAFKNSNKVGDIVEGDVVNLLAFGAFVRLEQGVDGLLHISQISKQHINKPSDVLKVGDKINVKIIDINEDERRISLSMKDIDKDEENVEDYEFINEELDTTIEDINHK